MVRLESCWLNKLSNRNWSEQCYNIYHKFLAESTLEQYNSYLNRYKELCFETYGEFPPQVQCRQASVAAFLHFVCRNSQRPQSLVKMSWSAITHFYDALDFDIRSVDMTHFMYALIKHGTLSPQGRTPIPPIQPILALFKKWECNESLPIDKLRQKCISLLCLTAMCRPSDIAPRLGFFRRQIRFNDDNSATITFFGIKNDSQKKGFEIKLSPASDQSLDPVQALKCYLQRTSENGVTNDDTHVFRSLTSPADGISASTVAKILRSCLSEAGLADEYTARSFRAAGATAAVKSGCDPDTARQIGRWKNREVFFDHYVYPGAPAITDQILSYE